MSVGVLAIVPAAGRSERFGAMKLLADVRGEPLLSHTLRCLIDAGLDAVVLVTSPDASFTAVALAGHPRVRTVVNPDPSRGMFSSIQAGLAGADAEIIVILPADMPFVSSLTVRTAIAECRRTRQVIVPTFEGRHGHPVVLPGNLAPTLATSVEVSLKSALRSIAGLPRELHVTDPGVVRDVDVPADLSGLTA